MTRKPRYSSPKLVLFIKRYVLWWYGITAVFYAAAIPFTILVFPNTTLVLSVIVLFSGFTSSLAAWASALLSAEQDKAIASLDDTVSDEKVEPAT